MVLVVCTAFAKIDLDIYCLMVVVSGHEKMKMSLNSTSISF